MARVGREMPGPGSMSFGKAMLYGLGTALGFFGAAMLLHFAGDVYERTIRQGLLKPADEEIPPPSNGASVGGMWPLYRR